EALDIITVSDELRNSSNLDSCGGPAYISALTGAVPTSANIEYYAKIVKQNSLRRNLARIASQILADTYNDGVDARSLVEETERKIYELTDENSGSSYKAVKEIIPQTVDFIEKLFHSKESYTGVPTGFDKLDNLTSGFQKSEFIVIGARPSIGKTALALSMAAYMAIHKQIRVGFFTLEMPDTQLVQRLLSIEARVNSQKLRTGMLNNADFRDITEACSRIYEAPLYIEDTPNMKLLDLRAVARRMKSKQDIQILFVDYLTLISAEKADMPRHEQIAEVSRSLKTLARELDIPVVALSQVRRETEGKRPGLADLRESGSLEQDADVVILLHRERDNESSQDSEGAAAVVTELIIAKQRNGPVDTIQLAFIPKFTKFESLSRDNP
ncbi:MAG: replicative DNA helicase, partial [Spirochaetales bacterium]